MADRFVAQEDGLMEGRSLCSSLLFDLTLTVCLCTPLLVLLHGVP